MKIVCAWCRDEGRPGYLGEQEPLDDPSPTHGVCSRHRERLLETLPSTSFPDAEMLIVVRPNDTALYEYLERTIAQVPRVKLIMERRSGNRRREQRPVADDRRRAERRIRQGTVSSLGYSVVRFKRSLPPGRSSGRAE